MDEYLKGTYCTIFKYWILSQKIKETKIYLEEDHHICMENIKYQGDIYFHEMNIIELKITNLISNENEFYLHFQMNNLKHATQLFEEMKECMEQVEKEKIIKVLLSCSGGLTTSYFASLLNETSQLLDLNIQVDAVASTQIKDVIENYDIVYLAPQVCYMLSTIKSYSQKVPVYSIPSQIFAKYDAKAFIQMLFNTINEQSIQEKISMDLKIEPRKKKNILCLSLFRDRKRIHIIYRYYNQNQVVILENEIIKLKITIQDIYDIIHYVISIYPQLEIIGISTPGYMNKNETLISTYLNGLDNCNIYELLKKEFHQDIYIYNDVNSAAAGYFASQNEYQNLVFLFQPVNHFPGAGIIINGQLIKGHTNLAGEIQFSSKHLKKEYFIEGKSQKEIMDVLMNDILTIISVIAPEMIIIYTELTDDTSELYRELSKIISSDALPIMKKVKNINEYIFMGLLYLCLD